VPKNARLAATEIKGVETPTGLNRSKTCDRFQCGLSENGQSRGFVADKALPQQITILRVYSNVESLSKVLLLWIEAGDILSPAGRKPHALLAT
jgi:hypothetical protein